MGTHELLTLSLALTSTRRSVRRRGTTDAWPYKAASCRGVEPYYRDRGVDDEGCKERQQEREMADGIQEEEGRSLLVTQRCQAAASQSIQGHMETKIPKDECLTHVGLKDTTRERVNQYFLLEKANLTREYASWGHMNSSHY